MIALEGRAPVGKDFLEPTTHNIGLNKILRCIDQTNAVEGRVKRRRDIVQGQLAVHTDAELASVLPEFQAYNAPELGSRNVLSLVLLGLGLGGLAGLSIAGFVLRRNLTAVLIGLPSALALLALLLIAVGPVLWATASLLVLWGLFNTPIPAAWGTWMAQIIPDDLEAGGGLQVALIQFAIAGGASAGGMLFDTAGWWSAFLLAAALLAGSALLAAAASPRA